MNLVNVCLGFELSQACRQVFRVGWEVDFAVVVVNHIEIGAVFLGIVEEHEVTDHDTHVVRRLRQECGLRMSPV